MSPKVTFIVPCYKLAHLLPDCVNSILSQSYQDYEILIMNDVSPDNTAEVAQSFADSRVRHILNEKNLGNLRNYNKGITMARGEYVWLISADDRLRKPYVLERYVAAMDAHPEVGFACCPATELRNDTETQVLYGKIAESDAIFKGFEFLQKLQHHNCVASAAGIVRKTYYEQLGAFPLDMGYAGDWYLWMLFAIHGDVAYFAEPMVNYRQHDGSMTSALMKDRAGVCAIEDLLVMWCIIRKAEEAGNAEAAKLIKSATASEYARQLTSGKYGIPALLTAEGFSRSLDLHAKTEAEKRWIRSRTYAQVGDKYFHESNPSRAAEFYSKALRQRVFSPRTFAKFLLTRTGPMGVLARRAFGGLRHATNGGGHQPIGSAGNI